MIHRHTWKHNPTEYFNDHEILLFGMSLRTTQRYAKAFKSMGIKVAALYHPRILVYLAYLVFTKLKGEKVLWIRPVSMSKLKELAVSRYIVVTTGNSMKHFKAEEKLHKAKIYDRLIEMSPELLECLQKSNDEPLLQSIETLEKENWRYAKRLIGEGSFVDYAGTIHPNGFRFNNERKCCFGELHPDKTFYVLKTEMPITGILSFWRIFLTHISYALDNGFIPIFDLKNYYCRMMQDEDNRYLENAWEYYFTQPFPEYSLDEVYKSKNVFFSPNQNGNLKNKESSLTRAGNPRFKKEALIIWHEHMEKYAHVRQEIWQNAMKLKEQLFGIERVMGVSLRVGYSHAAALNRPHINNHGKQPSIDEMIIEIKKRLDEWGCSRLFLAIDDSEAFSTLQEEFGDALLSIDRPRLRLFINGVPTTTSQQGRSEIHLEYPKNPVQNLTIDYLTEAIILSQCDSLLTSPSAIIHFAIVANNGKYRNTHIINKGIYKV